MTHFGLFTCAEMHLNLGVLSTSHPGRDRDSTDALLSLTSQSPPLPETPGEDVAQEVELPATV